MTNWRKYARIQRICECKIRNNDTDLQPQIKKVWGLMERLVTDMTETEILFDLLEKGISPAHYGTAWNLKAGGKICGKSS